MYTHSQSNKGTPSALAIWIRMLTGTLNWWFYFQNKHTHTNCTVHGNNYAQGFVVYCCGLLLDGSIQTFQILLTCWGQDKMLAIFQMTFSDAFSWIKMYEFGLRFHRIFFLRVEWITLQHWLRWWLCTDQTTSHYLNRWWLDYQCIYVSLDLKELSGSTGTIKWLWAK